MCYSGKFSRIAIGEQRIPLLPVSCLQLLFLFDFLLSRDALAGLISHGAARLAGGLARSLALTAAALFQGCLKLWFVHRKNVFHRRFPPYR